VDACAELPIEDAVDVERGELRIIGQQLVDGLFNLGKPGGGENGGYPPTKNGDIRSLLCA